MDPAKHSIPYGSLIDIVKRTVYPPSKNYYYITESVDGTVHNLIDKSGNKLSSTNDNGNLSEIQSIWNTIMNRLKSEYASTQESVMENIAEKEKRTRLANRLQYGEGYSSMISPFEDSEILIGSLRRKKRIISRMNRKSDRVPKKKIIKRKTK